MLKIYALKEVAPKDAIGNICLVRVSTPNLTVVYVAKVTLQDLEEESASFFIVPYNLLGSKVVLSAIIQSNVDI